MNTAAYAAIESKAAGLGLPKHFPADLTIHDRETIANQPPARRFLWAVGHNGTFLAWLDARRENARELADTVLDMFPHTFIWDGVALRAVAPNDVADILRGSR